MPGTFETADPDEIQDWIEEHGGEPAISENSGELRVDFGDQEELVPIPWKEFLEILEQERLMMVYEEDVIAGSDESSPSEEYEFVTDTRDTPEDVPDTEMDDDDVLGNMEETST